ncbi:MAG: isochorismatase family protein, partial [Alphaproteobacteria bacterium]|nr:isochorismatase family protein [Alphaproteobacteria bacterium]
DGLRRGVEFFKDRKQIVICGIEAHVCVLQTAIEFNKAGYQVYVVADAVSSRSVENVDLALRRMSYAGVNIVSVEMVLFEWLGKAGSAEFKEVSGLIK